MDEEEIRNIIFDIPDGDLKDAPKQNDVDKYRLLDCNRCGSFDSVEYDPDHVHESKVSKLKIPAEARICQVCDHIYYEGAVFQKILETEEKARGNHHVRFVINHGQLSKYTLH